MATSRRSFLAMLGLAPVAGTALAKAELPQQSVGKIPVQEIFEMSPLTAGHCRRISDAFIRAHAKDAQQAMNFHRSKALDVMNRRARG